MDIKESDTQRRRQVFYAISGAGLLVVIGFALFHYIDNQQAPLRAQLSIGTLLAGALLAMRFGISDTTVYRIVLWGVALAECYIATLGSSLLYYHLVMPVIFFFLLGRRDGIVLTCVFLLSLVTIMVTPWLSSGAAYETGDTVRFLVASLFAGLIAWSYENTRERFHEVLADKNRQLESEMELLNQALSEINTLSGLIPICASCKSIRDDSGFWHRVETYVSERSNASFSHGICPDCTDALYPELSETHDRSDLNQTVSQQG